MSFWLPWSPLLITGAGNSWNDCLDVEIDKINQPDRVLPSGKITPRSAWIFSIVLTVIALLIAAFINLAAFVVALLAALTLYIYSWKLKSTVLMGNATVAGISALSIVFGGIAAGNIRPTLLPAAIIATAILGREILKTLADYEGDLRQRVRTISTAWGRRPARIFFFVIAAATGWVMMLPYLLEIYKPIYGLHRDLWRLSCPHLRGGEGPSLGQWPATGTVEPDHEARFSGVVCGCDSGGVGHSREAGFQKPQLLSQKLRGGDVDDVLQGDAAVEEPLLAVERGLPVFRYTIGRNVTAVRL